ncbi:hypothetical protein [Bradyrhizobium sp. BR 10289]|uniref:hypothetical protein n=1 Tax=Bradyrhizobium sp. BR 10289 TaxID=2749993 RepID=UPI001C64925A|nr:hypothetical protein [Bradyrhizobium sp. BR 10289]MBW7974593.1 hypothetical protein [Bradyrhizobium sp. BR 10289]
MIAVARWGQSVAGRRTVPLEELLWHFRHSRGLFLLGAGASAGIVPFGQRFMAAPSLDFLEKWTALSASRAKQDLLTRRSIEFAMPSLLARRGELGFDLEMSKAILSHMPNGVASFHQVHELAKARLNQRRDDLRYRNYGIFEFFPSTTLLNYNLDGIADDICGGHHQVIPVHGSVKVHLGAPDIARVLQSVRDFGFEIEFEDLLLCVPEPNFGKPGHQELVARLAPMWGFEPDFVAICGYSFASTDPTSHLKHDDHESLRLFVDRFRDYDGRIYVLNPDRSIAEMIEARLKSRNVIWVPQKWNVLAAAMMDRITGGGRSEPLRDAYSRLEDETGGFKAFHGPKAGSSRFAGRGF